MSLCDSQLAWILEPLKFSNRQKLQPYLTKSTTKKHFETSKSGFKLYWCRLYAHEISMKIGFIKSLTKFMRQIDGTHMISSCNIGRYL